MKAIATKLALFVVVLLLAMLTASDWHGLDHAVFAQLLTPAAKPEERITLVELPDRDPSLTQSALLREALGQTLTELARRRPARVAVDIQLGADGGSPAPVLQGLDALRAANVPVYLVIDPDVPSDALAAEVYAHAAVAGVGHSRLWLDGRVAYYRPVVQGRGSGFGKAYDFLPALLAGVNTEDLPGHQVFGTPRLGERPLGRSLSELPDTLPGQIVLVASSERECRVHQSGRDRGDDDLSLCRGAPGSHDWSGPELLVWSLTDLLRGHASRILRPIYSPGWVLAAALVAAAMALAAHALLLRRAGRNWSPTMLSRRLAWVTAAALGLAVAALGLVGTGLLQLGWLLPPTFPTLAIATAAALCHWHVRGRMHALLAEQQRRAADNAITPDVDVFISYSHAPDNAPWVEREILAPLQAMRLSDGRALRIFFDRQDITVSQQWFSRINLSILGSRCFLCVWSDDYMERDYCRWELQYAYPLAAKPDHLFLPVSRLAPERLASPAYAQYLQLHQTIDAGSRPDFFVQVREALLRHLDPAAPRGQHAPGPSTGA